VFSILLAASAVAAYVATKKVSEVKKMTAIAEDEMARNRHMLYASNVKLAQQAYETGNLSLGQQLLNSYLPQQQSNGQQEDLRGFEFYYLWRLYHSELATLKDNSFEAFKPNSFPSLFRFTTHPLSL
jgi:cytochrome c1